MKIYISIPITGHDFDKQSATAKEIETLISDLGHTPVNPFNTPAPPSWMESEQEQYAHFMGEDIKELLLCDAIYMANGWKDSKGCSLEYMAAQIYGLKIYDILQYIPTK